MPLMNASERVNLLKGKGLSLSMCSIPLPPIPSNQSHTDDQSSSKTKITKNVSEGRWGHTSDVATSDDKISGEQCRRKTVAYSTQEKYRSSHKSSTLNKYMYAANQEYYFGNMQDDIAPSTSSFGHKTTKVGSVSPEYEVLVHSQSKSIESKEKSKSMTRLRPSRPPPPVPNSDEF